MKKSKHAKPPKPPSTFYVERPVFPGEVQIGPCKVPAAFAKIVVSTDRFSVDVEGFASKANVRIRKQYEGIYAYLVLGWAYGLTHTHMIEIEFKDRHATDVDLAIALGKLRRCYCAERCLDADMHNDEKSTRELLAVLELRKTVAEANGIPLDGTPENEAKIDAVLSEATS